MNKLIITALLLMTSPIAVAENVIRAIAPINKAPVYGEWVYSEPVLGAWEISSSEPCSQWTPPEDQVSNGYAFVQSQACETTEARTRQERQINTVSNVLRNNGEPVLETRMGEHVTQRNAVGTGNFTEHFFVVGWGYCPYGQYGYTYNNTCSSKVFYEGSIPSSAVYYFTYGYGSAINFALSPRITKDQLVYLRVEMINEGGGVYYTNEFYPPFSNQYSNYIGPYHTANDLAQASVAKRFKVTYRVIN
jgi:hypothetical protein